MKNLESFLETIFIPLKIQTLYRNVAKLQAETGTSVHYFVRAVLSSTRSLFISAARPRAYASSHVPRIFLGYLFSVHHGIESISCRNRSRVTLSDWKPVSTKFSPDRRSNRIPEINLQLIQRTCFGTNILGSMTRLRQDIL